MKPLYISLKPFLDHCSLSRPACWQDVFGTANPVQVEIGFGNGEYLAKISVEQPQINFVGFEEYCERISRTLRKLSRLSSNNVRVMRMDARTGLKFLFAPSSIDAIYCLFPPPWPKKSDFKHRLFCTEFLRLANSRLRSGGVLKIVTDHHPYAAWILEQVPGSGFAVDHKIIPASYGTKFEKKWEDGGQTDFNEILLTKQTHQDIAQAKDAPVEHYILKQFDPAQFHMEEYSDGKIAVVFKDFLYDPKRETGLVYVMVHDEHLLQNVRIMIVKDKEGWRVRLAQGSMLMPTTGVAKAIELVRDAAVKS